MAIKDHAAPLWDRAEECRATANAAFDLQIKAGYMKLANDYLKLAAQEEALMCTERTERLLATNRFPPRVA